MCTFPIFHVQFACMLCFNDVTDGLKKMTDGLNSV